MFPEQTKTAPLRLNNHLHHHDQHWHIKKPLLAELQGIRLYVQYQKSLYNCFFISWSKNFQQFLLIASKASTSAIQLASMMFSLTPTVLQTSDLSLLSITTLTRAAVPSVVSQLTRLTRASTVQPYDIHVHGQMLLYLLTKNNNLKQNPQLTID